MNLFSSITGRSYPSVFLFAGLDFDGLYRINGNQAQIQKLRFMVDNSQEDYSLDDYDVNVLTGALKLFFRELKEPLVPFQLYSSLSESIRKYSSLSHCVYTLYHYILSPGDKNYLISYIRSTVSALQLNLCTQWLRARALVL